MMLFVVLLFGLQMVYWFVGRGSSKEREDYFLAGRGVSLFPLMMTFLATQVGGGLVLGAADEAYRFGWVVLCYPLGVALGLIVLGLGVGQRWARLGLSTTAEIFETAYRSRALRKVASLLSMGSLFMVLTAQILASSKFLTSMGMTSTPLFVLFWGVVIVYASRGGLKALIATDIVQVLVFSSVLVGAFGWIAVTCPRMEELSSGAWESVSGKWVGWLLMPLLFMMIEQDMGQRCVAGKCPKTVSRATLLSGVLTFGIASIPVALGCLAHAMGLCVGAGESVLMKVIGATTGPLVHALVGCAVLAAIISTATSLLNAISSNMQSDFNLGSKNPQWVTALIACCALSAAFFCRNIVDVLIKSYDLSVSVLFVPIVFALFQGRGGVVSAALAMGFGAVGFLFVPAYAIVLSFIGYGLGWVWGRVVAQLQRGRY